MKRARCSFMSTHGTTQDSAIPSTVTSRTRPKFDLSAALPPVEGCGSLTFHPSLDFSRRVPQPKPTPAKQMRPPGTTSASKSLRLKTILNLQHPSSRKRRPPCPRACRCRRPRPTGCRLAATPRSRSNRTKPGVSARVADRHREGHDAAARRSRSKVRCSSANRNARRAPTAMQAEGHIFRLFIQVHSEKLGITIKLPGAVQANHRRAS